MNKQTAQLIRLIEELYSGWSETNDSVRQRDGHPPKEQTEIAVDRLLNDLRQGLAILQVDSEGLFTEVKY